MFLQIYEIFRRSSNCQCERDRAIKVLKTSHIEATFDGNLQFRNISVKYFRESMKLYFDLTELSQNLVVISTFPLRLHWKFSQANYGFLVQVDLLSYCQDL